MHIQKASKYAALIISILSASLINEYAVKYINSYYKDHSYKSVLIGMVVTVVVFVPMFSVVGKWLTKASKSYVKAGKKVAANSLIGLLVSFIIALIILFVFFAEVRHGLHVVNTLKQFFK